MSLSPFVPTPDFAEYSARFKDHFLMERRADGVLLVKAHTQGGSLQLSVENHRALGNLRQKSDDWSRPGPSRRPTARR